MHATKCTCTCGGNKIKVAGIGSFSSLPPSLQRQGRVGRRFACRCWLPVASLPCGSHARQCVCVCVVGGGGHRSHRTAMYSCRLGLVFVARVSVTRRFAPAMPNKCPPDLPPTRRSTASRGSTFAIFNHITHRGRGPIHDMLVLYSAHAHDYLGLSMWNWQWQISIPKYERQLIGLINIPDIKGVYLLSIFGDSLVPKIKEAEQIQQYRPICHLNVSFIFLP